MNEVLDSETQQKIINIIEQNPGILLSEIADILHIKIGIVKDHLDTLWRDGEIVVLEDKGFRKYYARKQSTPEDAKSADTGQQIYNLILKNPGLHLSKIAESLKMSTSLAEYHLIHLEKNEQIMAVKGVGGYYKRYYVRDSSVGVREVKILALLRQDVLLKIIILLWKHPNLHHSQLLKKLRLSPSTLTYHMSKLIEYDIVQKLSYGQKKGYILKNEKEIIWIIRRHKLDQTLDRFKDLWEELHPK